MFLNKFVIPTSERPRDFSGETKIKYHLASEFSVGKKVLDIGSGLGKGVYYLAKSGAKEVIGIDYSASAVKYAQKNHLLPNLKFKVMDAKNLTFPSNFFDVITAFEVIEHLPGNEHLDFIKNLKRILKANGVFLISTPNRLISSPDRQQPINPFHQKEYLPQEFVQLAKKYFSSLKLLGIKCTNKQFLKKRLEISQSWRAKLTKYLSSFKLTHCLLPLIPQKIKDQLSLQNSLPILRESDFKILKNRIETCQTLLLICSKKIK